MNEKQKMFNSLAMALFLVALGLHGLRMLSGWDLWLGGYLVPMWVSGVVVLLTAFLLTVGFKLNDRK